MTRKFLAGELLASVVVFLVALPLCMGVAIASGLPPAAGLLTGIIGGLVVGALSGSPLQVSGPAAGLTVIVWELTQRHGVGTLGVIVLLAGAFQLLAGVFKLGQWFRAVSPSVVYGMLAGIGVLIMASQIHVMVDDKPRAGGLANLLALPDALWKGLVPMDGTVHHLAAAVGVLTIAAMALWNAFKPKALHAVPAPLVAIALAMGATYLFHLPIQHVTVPANLLTAVSLPGWDVFQHAFEPAILGAAAAMALVASAETLLCATAVDQMHQGPRTAYSRELVAQGIGNMLCGVVGALPMTGVIVRSSANIEAGARTRLSAILHGAWLLAFVSLLPFVLGMVPVASLAAVLVYTGYKLVNVKNVKVLWQHGRSEVAIYGATVAMIVATSLLEGVLVGLALSAVKLLYTFTRLQVRLAVTGPRADLALSGAATFVGVPRLAEALGRVPAGSELHVHFEELSYVDHACLDLLHSWERQHAATGGQLVLEWQDLRERYRPPARTLAAVS